MNEQRHCNGILAQMPQELQPFDERHGTAKVCFRSFLKAADWLIAKGYADSRLKAALRKAVRRG